MEEKNQSFKQELPPLVQEHVFSDALVDHYGEIFEGLDLKQTKPFNGLVWKVYRRELRVGEFFRQASDLKLPEWEKKIWPGILRYDFLPIADYLSLNIKDGLRYFTEKELGDLEIVLLVDFLNLILTEKQKQSGAEEKSNLVKDFAEYLSGNVDEKELAVALSKPAKFGGLEMPEEISVILIRSFQKKWIEAQDKNQIVTAQPVTQDMVQQAITAKKVATVKKETVRVVEAPTREVGVPVLKPAPPPPLIKPVEKKPVLSPQPKPIKVAPITPVKRKIEEELPVIASTGPGFVPPMQQYDAMAEKLIAESGVKVPTDLAQRFKILVISRLKDVRKAGETLERLQADPLNGGLGLNQAEAEKIIKSMEGERSKEGELKTPPVAPKITKEPKLEIEEKVELKVEAPVAVPKPVVSPSSKQTTSDIQKIQPTAIKIVSQPDKQPAKVEFAEIPQAVPEPPKPKPTMAIPQTVAGKSKVEDVAYRPRLLGPVDELKEMTLLDFHRLSPKIKVAVDKIYAKIELLSKEGYDRRIKGAQAWQESPTNKLYSAILNESLKRFVPVAKVIEERLTAKKETLTLEEFKEIVQLNKNLGL